MTITPAVGADSALFSLIRKLADNKYWLGRRYAEWCTAAPSLESAVAAAAMAQDEIGHARSHYPLFRQFLGEDVEPETQDLFHSMACLDLPFGGWCDFVAANLLVDTALTTVYLAALNSSYDDLRNRARRITGEEEVHWLHARGWVRRLTAGNNPVRDALVQSASRVWPEVVMWFGRDSDADAAELLDAGVLSKGPNEQRAGFLGQVEPLLQPLESEAWSFSIEIDCLPWGRWDSERGRLVSSR